MKKRNILFCVIPFVLFVCVLGTSLLLPTQISYPFKTIQGDISVLDDLGYQVVIRTNNAGNDNKEAMITLTNKQGRTSIQKKYHTKLEDGTTKNLVLDSKVSTYTAGDGHVDNYYYGDTEDSCKEIKESLDSLPIRYQIGFENGGAIYQEKGTSFDDVLILDTGLYYKNNENQRLTKTKTICDGEEVQDSYVDGNREILTEEYGWYSDTRYALPYKTNIFYAMPYTDENVYGQNKIYRIDIIEKERTEPKGRIKEIVQLPIGRTYDRLIIAKDTLYVLANAADGSYLMSYRMDGTFLKEVAIANTNIRSISAKTNDHYILIESESYIYVIDTATMQLTMRYEKPNTKYTTLYDMLYHKGTLYLLHLQEEWETIEGIPQSKLTKSNVIVEAVKGDRIIFQGVQLISGHQKEENVSLINVWEMKFERGDGS